MFPEWRKKRIERGEPFYAISERYLTANRRLLFGCESECIQPHLLEHGSKAIAARGGEMFSEIDGVDEIQVCIDNLAWCVAAQYADKQGYNSLDQDGVGVASIDDNGVIISVFLLFEFCGEPHFGLATVNEILFGSVSLGERFQAIAVVDEKAVSVHPIIEGTEFFDDFVLDAIDAC